jgi:sugar phosphate isomerase/epimerase
MGEVPQAFDTVKNHIRSTHVHDNARDRDSHLWPGDGSVDWKQAMELLRTAPHQPPLLLEIEGEEKISPLQKIEAAFKKLEEI